MIFITDAQGALTGISPEWSAFTGQPRAEAFGAGWLAQVHPEDRDAIRALFAAAVGERRDFSLRYRLRNADGYVWVGAGAVPSFGPPDRTFLGYLGSVTQIAPSGSEDLRAYGTVGRFVPPPAHPATVPHTVLELVADHLLMAHGLLEADSGGEILPVVRRALALTGTKLAEAPGTDGLDSIH